MNLLMKTDGIQFESRIHQLKHYIDQIFMSTTTFF